MSEPMIWRYDGAWARVPDPVDWGDESDVSKVLRREGFTHSTSWDSGLVDVYEHDSDDRWRLGVCLDTSHVREIEVIGLPHVISLLRDLAAIATASVLSTNADLLQNLIFNAAEDADRERKQRHSR